MTNKTDYTDDEWLVLLRAPMVAGLAISFADPGGPFDSRRRSSPPSGRWSHRTRTEELLVAVSQDAMAHAQHRENVLGDFKPKGAMAGRRFVDELRAANGRSSSGRPRRGGGHVPHVARLGRASRRRCRRGGRVPRDRRRAGERP